MDLADHLRAMLALDPSAPEIEYEDRWVTWGELAALAEGVHAAIAASGAPSPVAAGVVLRNRPELVGAVLGVLLAGGCVVTLNPHQGDASLAAEIEALRVPVVIATAEDWSRDEVVSAVSASGSAALSVGLDGGAAVAALSGLDRARTSEPRVADAGVAIEMLTSGTTGPPKRIPLHRSAFEKTIAAAGAHYRTSDDEATAGPRLRSGAAIVASPFVHMSGLFRTLLNVCEGRRIALLDRFRVETWVEAVRRHRPKAVSLVPTALRMVLDAEVPADVFESVQVVTSGSAALDPALQRRFEDTYGVAVLPSYGATEFAGGVAGWTLPLHREWSSTKLGSVGRPQPGRRLRVVDPATGDAVPTGEQGLLEVGGSDNSWTRTNDLARLDEDGFLWIDGRVDDAIIRGGFKVFPGEIVELLRSHPAVRDAGVVGIPDERLGSVPVAAVELVDGATADVAELDAHLRAHLTSYKVPAALRVVDRLPRTPSLKVSGPGVQALFTKENR